MKSVMSDMFTAICISTAGGLMAVLTRFRLAHGNINILDVIYLLATAVFTGFLVHCICCEFATTAPGTGFYMASVAIAGYAARPILRLVKLTIIRKLRRLITGNSNTDEGNDA